ncbi:MAG: RDD family protein [bacterium]
MELGKLYNRAWEIVKKHKSLWVLGVVTAAVTTGGITTNFNYRNSSPNKSSSTVPLKTDFEQLFTGLNQFLISVPLWVWILLISGIVAAILYALLFRLYVRAWAKGSMIRGIEEVDKNDTTSLHSSSLSARKVLNKLVLINLIPLGITFCSSLFIIAVVVIGGITIWRENYNSLFILIPLALLFIAIIVIVNILFAAVSIWAERLIVLKDYSVKKALLDGFNNLKQQFGNMFLIGISNFGIGCIGGCVVLIPMGILGIALVFSFLVFPPVALVIVPLLVVCGLALIIVRGIYEAFKAAAWSLLYKESVSPALEISDYNVIPQPLQSQHSYAGFLPRLLAWGIDTCILVLPAFLFLALLITPSTSLNQLAVLLLAFFAIFIVWWTFVRLAYMVLFTSYLGGTPGKIITGLEIVTEYKQRLTLKESLFRATIGYFVSDQVFGLGYTVIIKDQKKQGWHDQVSLTYVIWKNKIITLLAVVIFILSIGVLGILSVNIGSKLINNAQLANTIEAVQHELESKRAK